MDFRFVQHEFNALANVAWQHDRFNKKEANKARLHCAKKDKIK